MVDVIHEHDSSAGAGASMGLVFGILMVILFMYLLFTYGMPYIRGGGNSTPSVTIPDQVDVNINGGNQGGTQ